jgi:hypothetical protein
MSELFVAVCSIAPTRRRRFLWAAWWTGSPSREPFRKPDAFQGGSRTQEEALAEAESAAGARLVEIEPRWARAWLRVLVGQPVWIETSAEKRASAAAGSPRAARDGVPTPSSNASLWVILGVAPDVGPEELKRAFRKRALEAHPDRGGTAAAFRELQRAYEEAQRRIARPRRQTRK